MDSYYTVCLSDVVLHLPHMMSRACCKRCQWPTISTGDDRRYRGDVRYLYALFKGKYPHFEDVYIFQSRRLYGRERVTELVKERTSCSSWFSNPIDFYVELYPVARMSEDEAMDEWPAFREFAYAYHGCRDSHKLLMLAEFIESRMPLLLPEWNLQRNVLHPVQFYERMNRLIREKEV